MALNVGVLCPFPSDFFNLIASGPLGVKVAWKGGGGGVVRSASKIRSV